MVMGIVGACGRINLTSLSAGFDRHSCAASIHPWPLSPRPWIKMTVAVCLPTASMMMGAARVMLEAILVSDSEGETGGVVARGKKDEKKWRENRAAIGMRTTLRRKTSRALRIKGPWARERKKLMEEVGGVVFWRL